MAGGKTAFLHTKEGAEDSYEDGARALQERLVALRYDPGTVDGRYGGGLTSAVMASMMSRHFSAAAPSTAEM